MDELKEQELVAKYQSDFTTAESAKTEYETSWSDNRKAFRGDHWDMSISRRSASVKKRRPNSVHNLIFPVITYKLYILAATTPEAIIQFVNEHKIKTGVMVEREEDSKETGIGMKLTRLIDDILYKNKYDLTWSRIMLQALQNGPFIGTVIWDNDMCGGSGPNRYNGEIAVRFIDIRDFYPDPAITDLEQDLQDCEFISMKLRKKLSYFKKQFKEKGEKVVQISEGESSDGDERFEGSDAKMGNLYLTYHKGKPEIVDNEHKKAWKKKLEDTDDYFEQQRYNDMINGNIEGVHLAMWSEGVLLDYKPYIYDDGMYPFSYTTIHVDHDNQWGFGEIEQLKIPQIEHNKASEIQIEAFSKKGLGSFFYNKGSITLKQITKIFKNFWKGGQAFEVNNKDGIKEITGTDVPASLENYRSSNELMIDKIGGYQDIQQGEAKAGTPYKLAELLGANADVRTTGISKKAEIFHREIIHLMVNRCMQFYKDGRKFKVRDGKSVTYEEFSKDELMEVWDRETEIEGESAEKEERYLPEYDVKVHVMDEKPQNRQYNMNLAFELFNAQVMDAEGLWEAVEEGTLPNKEEVLKRMMGTPEEEQAETQYSQEQISQVISQLPPEQQQQLVSLYDTDPAQYKAAIDQLMSA